MEITKTKKFNISNMVCPVPLRKYPNVVLGHGSGGQMTEELIQNLFQPEFSKTNPVELTDAAVINLPSVTHQIAFTTDSFVINPLFFPGGDIGSLAVHGTVNDLSVMGAVPVYISAGFIIEEGLPMETLVRIVKSMADAAKRSGVTIITGDTKVVQKNHGDGLYINTSGIGIIAKRQHPHPKLIEPGDVLIVNGNIGDHGMAVMSVREGLSFESEIKSDSAPLNSIISKLLENCPEVHTLRDLTRGGLAAALNELARSSNSGMVLFEKDLPVNPQVKSSCEIMGFDPVHIANEGKFIAIVPKSKSKIALNTLKSHPLGKKATIIGEVTEDNPGIVIGKTVIGSERIIDMPAGELLPRIC